MGWTERRIIWDAKELVKAKELFERWQFFVFTFVLHLIFFFRRVGMSDVSLELDQNAAARWYVELEFTGALYGALSLVELELRICVNWKLVFKRARGFRFNGKLTQQKSSSPQFNKMFTDTRIKIGCFDRSDSYHLSLHAVPSQVSRGVSDAVEFVCPENKFLSLGYKVWNPSANRQRIVSSSDSEYFYRSTFLGFGKLSNMFYLKLIQ